jgi:23S rRNA (cytosine1962-C5)-methyltransferase
MQNETVQSPALPKVTISRRAAAKLKAGHVWVYRSDLAGNPEIPAAALVAIQDERGKFLGTGLYSSSSQIAVRKIADEGISDLRPLFSRRMNEAIAYRERFVQNTDAYRLIFSEADFLPGLIVDRYNDLLSFQVLTQAMDANPVRETILEELNRRFHPAGIVERVDSRIRELEQLPERSPSVVQGEKSGTVFTMNGVQFHYDALEGQKTGAFLDQRENYAAAAQYARGEALDVFCYQGGFALHLAQAGCKVTGVDSSRSALEIADRNAALNQREVEWIEANAFDLLRDYAGAGRHYDIIVLDPPAFAKSKKNLDTAVRGYKELNLRALKMLRAGGILVTCTCSYHVGDADFLSVVSQAALDTHKNLRLLENRAQAKDHPIVVGIPETAYLNCLVFCVS